MTENCLVLKRGETTYMRHPNDVKTYHEHNEPQQMEKQTQHKSEETTEVKLPQKWYNPSLWFPSYYDDDHDSDKEVVDNNVAIHTEIEPISLRRPRRTIKANTRYFNEDFET